MAGLASKNRVSTCPPCSRPGWWHAALAFLRIVYVFFSVSLTARDARYIGGCVGGPAAACSALRVAPVVFAAGSGTTAAQETTASCTFLHFDSMRVISAISAAAGAPAPRGTAQTGLAGGGKHTPGSRRSRWMQQAAAGNVPAVPGAVLGVACRLLHPPSERRPKRPHQLPGLPQTGGRCSTPSARGSAVVQKAAGARCAVGGAKPLPQTKSVLPKTPHARTCSCNPGAW